MSAEISKKVPNGFLMLFVFILLLAGTVLFGADKNLTGALACGLIAFFISSGFFIVNPNTSRVLVLFGEYKGTVKDNGFFWVLPFYVKKEVSLRARNFESERLKVNDKLGNPIMISAILVWKVEDTYKAMFDIDHYESFVKIQTDSAVRKLAGTYPYDQFEDEKANVTLSASFEEVNRSLEEEVGERLKLAGLSVIEARIGYLAYAPEIAQAMLKRQQATAIIAARSKMVEGAVGMVEGALKLLSQNSVVQLDENRKAAMVSNLLVVLCGDSEATPVVNAGSGD
jgi:regulator of protease activity HflC (stomatin/prohibitin superfamily)